MAASSSSAGEMVTFSNPSQGYSLMRPASWEQVGVSCDRHVSARMCSSGSAAPPASACDGRDPRAALCRGALSTSPSRGAPPQHPALTHLLRLRSAACRRRWARRAPTRCSATRSRRAPAWGSQCIRSQ